MLDLISTLFLSGHLVVFYNGNINHKVSTVDSAVAALEPQFLDHRSRRVNEEKWEKLAFDKQPHRHEHVIKEPLFQITELGKLCTDIRNEDHKFAKTITAVQDLPAHSGICANPPDTLQALHAPLLSSQVLHNHVL